MTHGLRAVLDPDGAGVLLERRDGPLDLRALREDVPGLRARRHHRGALVAFPDAPGLLPGTGLDWDADALRAVRNRAAVAAAAPGILAEARRIQAAGVEEARKLVADSRLADRLDGHQLVNLAVLTLPGGWGGCVFDEQGTGKTVTTIATFDLLAERGEADVLLVVCPKSMAAEWAGEVRRFTGDLYRVAVAADGDRAARAGALDLGADVVVVNYETAVALAPSLRALARRARVVLAVDESFFVKNPSAVRTSAVSGLREWCVRAYALCGTPAPNSPADVVSQFDLVDFGHAFRGVRLTGDRAADEAPVRRAMTQGGLYVRNLKEHVLTDLPGRRFDDVLVPLAPAQQQAYDRLRDGLVADLRAMDDEAFARARASFLARRARLLRLCSDPAGVVPGHVETPAKDEVLDELLADLVGAQGEKVVVWSFYRATLDRLAARYAHHGLVRIDGSVTDTAARRAAVRDFQSDDRTMVFLGNPAAAGAGLTLHRARFMIYESLGNQAAHHLQSLDRVHRRGQTRDVTYLTLLGQGTLEEAEYRRLRSKAAGQADLLGDTVAPVPTRQLLLEELLASGPERTQ